MDDAFQSDAFQNDAFQIVATKKRGMVSDITVITYQPEITFSNIPEERIVISGHE